MENSISKKNLRKNIKSAGSSIINSQKQNTSVTTQNLRTDNSQASINLSKIQYKEGFIMNDACNPNPGFGLWVINPNASQTTHFINEKPKTVNNNYKSVNDITDDYSKYLINKLKEINEDLEKKLANAYTGYSEMKNKYITAEKIMQEYKDIIEDNKNQINDLTNNKNKALFRP